MKKRISALLLSVVLCLGMFSMTAFAAEISATGTAGGNEIKVTGVGTRKLCTLWNGVVADGKLMLLFYTDNSGEATIKLGKGATLHATDEVAGNYEYYIGIEGHTGDPIPVKVSAAPVAVTGVSLNKDTLSLTVGGSETLNATVKPDGATNPKVSWESSDLSVATVVDGKVTAVAAGTATITVTTEDGGFTDTCEVRVTEPSGPVAVTGVTLNTETLELTVGQDGTLTAMVEPANAANKDVTWTSSNNEIATVDANGKVTAVKEGTVTITVTTVDGGKTATCAVTVKPQSSTNVPVTGVSLNKTSTSLTVGNTETLTATITPSNATNKTVTWTSSNTAVATVDSSGKVAAVAAGTATITVTTADGAKTATCTVTVTSGGGGSTGGGGGGGGSSSSSSNVTVKATKNGSVSYSPSRPSKGNTVTLTVRPNSGYQLDSIKVLDSNGAEVELTKTADDKYTFVMPSGRVTVESQFVKSDNSSTDTPTTPQFTDVSANSYYYDAVQWAVENGVTTGVNATTFNPDGTCTRAQMVTFLWRAAGSPTVEGTSPFTDVTSGSYYYQAVLWAVQQGITTGTTATTFNPNGLLTRAHTVTFLYRYAGSPAVTTVSSFSDVAAGQYYTNAVSWAVAEGITNGYDNNQFRPANNCTRAQTVTFLYRMLNK